MILIEKSNARRSRGKKYVLRNVQYSKIRFRGAYIDVLWNTIYKTARIEAIYVPPKLRGKGLGRALVEIVEDMLKYMGVKTVVTSTVTEDVTGFWEKLGYKKVYELHGLSVYMKTLIQ